MLNNMLNHCFPITTTDLVSQDIVEITIVLFVLMFSLILSTLFVSNCVYKTMINEFVEKYNYNMLLYEYDPYFHKFLEDYDSLEKQELSTTYLNSLSNKYIKECTPCGIVILTYNNEYNSFDYYCKKSNSIGFNYLEVVSRIYVVNFDCKNIYNDNYNNLIMLYNIKYGIINDDIDSVNYCEKSEKSGNVFFTKKTNASKKLDAYNFVSNRYKYKGTIDDFHNYCKIKNLIICYNNAVTDVSENVIMDSSSCFFSLEAKTNLVDDKSCANVIKAISFKTFKTFKTFDSKNKIL
jgi:hypothetical protein